MAAPPGPASAFEQALRDLDAIVQRLPAMHETGWWPSPPDRDRPTRPVPPGAGPDFAPGAPRDCGLGDHQVRQGWQRMVADLHAAEQAATDVLCAALARESRRVQPCRPTSLLDAQSCARRLRERLAATQRLWRVWSGDNPDVPTWQVDVGSAQWLARELMGQRGAEHRSCFGRLRCAADEARRVIVAVGNGKPPAMCVQCRRTGTIGQPRLNGVCYGCDARNKRAGVPRRTTVVAKQRRATLRAKWR